MHDRSDAELLVAFEQGSIAAEHWTHRTHVLVAYTLLREHDFDEALVLLRRGLRRQLDRLGIADSLESGYHETLTVGWLRLIHNAMLAHGPGDDFAAFCAEHPYLLVRRLIRALYRRETLCSWQAKREFVEPDILRFANGTRDTRRGGRDD